MSVTFWGHLLPFLCAPAANLFWLLYGTTTNWYRRLTGWAIIISKLGLAALVDATVLYLLLGRDYSGHAVVLIVAFGIITVGTWLYLIAFAREQYLKRNSPRGQA